MIRSIDPSQYQRTPWKNGGGFTIDIAADGEIWRLSRTPITAPGPFSDYTGCDRVQVLLAGRGLVLQAPDAEIDVRTPFRPVRFRGETPITSRLEAGPVEVLNLIGRRAVVAIDLAVLNAGSSRTLGRGRHIVYCPADDATVTAAGTSHSMAADHGLLIDDAHGASLEAVAGRIIVASIRPV